MALDPTISLQVKTMPEINAQILKNQSMQQDYQFNQQAMPLKLQAVQSELQMAPLKMESEKLALAKEKLAHVSQLLGSSVDQATWTANRNTALQNGYARPEELPEQFLPEFKQQALMKALTADKQIDVMLRQQDYSEKQRHNKAMEQGKFNVVGQDAEGNPVYGPAQKAPSGFRQTPEGNLEAIPGGPADLKYQQNMTKDDVALKSGVSDLDRLELAANALKNHPGTDSITGLAGMIPNRPGSEASDAHALLSNLKSQIGFSVLQTMRNNSKTGGALGNVSDAEGKRLEENLAALSEKQSPEQFKQQLDKIIEYTQSAKDRLSSAFNEKYGDKTEVKPTQSKKEYSLKDVRERAAKEGVPVEKVIDFIHKNGGKVQ